jgi:carboxyl-terminal processing protease
MNRSRLLFLLLSLVVMVPIVTGTLMARSEDEGDDSLFKYLSVFQDVLRLIRQAYVEEVSVDMLMEGALDGASDALDPFSTFVPAESVEGFREALAVGARHSGLTVAKDRGIVYVVSVTAGSPAALAGIERGDILTSVGGRPTRPTPLWRIQQALAGAPGTSVALELLRAGAPRSAEVELAEFESPPIEVSMEGKSAVLHLLVLDEATVADVGRQLEELSGRGVSRLLLDLRDTVSASPEMAYSLAELFAAGRLGSLHQGESIVESFESSRGPVWDGDVVVLVGRGSIGAAEIAASVLREALGARLVGQASFGHAGRLSLVPMSNGAHLLLTDAFYSGPNGEPLSESLEPDVEVGERQRRFADKDMTIEDLTMRRGLELLEGVEAPQLEDVA